MVAALAIGVNLPSLHLCIKRGASRTVDAAGKIQMDDAYLGGELSGGKAGRGSENKIPIVAAVSLNEAVSLDPALATFPCRLLW